MSAKPLAEAYEKLKELRRQGESAPEVQSRIGHQLREMYSDVVRQGVPDRFAELIRKLDAASEVAGESGKSANLVRNLEIDRPAHDTLGSEFVARPGLTGRVCLPIARKIPERHRLHQPRASGEISTEPAVP